MKKSEKSAEIMKRARAYAESGEYSGWLKIEHKISAEGFPEARNVLDFDYIRRNLDEKCRIAQSSEEGERRRLFDKLLSDTKNAIEPRIKEVAPNASVWVQKSKLIIDLERHKLEISRCFGSDKLLVGKYLRDSGYLAGAPECLHDSNFRTISEKDLEVLIFKRLKLSRGEM